MKLRHGNIEAHSLPIPLFISQPESPRAFVHAPSATARQSGTDASSHSSACASPESNRRRKKSDTTSLATPPSPRLFPPTAYRHSPEPASPTQSQIRSPPCRRSPSAAPWQRDRLLPLRHLRSPR